MTGWRVDATDTTQQGEEWMPPIPHDRVKSGCHRYHMTGWRVDATDALFRFAAGLPGFCLQSQFIPNYSINSYVYNLNFGQPERSERIDTIYKVSNPNTPDIYRNGNKLFLKLLDNTTWKYCTAASNGDTILDSSYIVFDMDSLKYTLKLGTTTDNETDRYETDRYHMQNFESQWI